MGLIHGALRELWRLLLSGIGAVVVIVVGCAALFVTSAPKWVSLALEPFSLLLTPGVGLSMMFTRAHDYTEMEILRGTFLFYVVALYGLLVWWGRRRSLGGGRVRR